MPLNGKLWSLLRVTLSLAWIVSFTMPLRAQVGTATLSGTVTDPSGGIVPKARVLVESVERKFSRESVTDSTGTYVFSALPPGLYQLDVIAPSFRQEKVADV